MVVVDDGGTRFSHNSYTKESTCLLDWRFSLCCSVFSLSTVFFYQRNATCNWKWRVLHFPCFNFVLCVRGLCESSYVTELKRNLIRFGVGGLSYIYSALKRFSNGKLGRMIGNHHAPIGR